MLTFVANKVWNHKNSEIHVFSSIHSYYHVNIWVATAKHKPSPELFLKISQCFSRFTRWFIVLQVSLKYSYVTLL